jgi:hypothetical protein
VFLGKAVLGTIAKPKVAALRLKADSEFLSFVIVNERFGHYLGRMPRCGVCGRRSATSLHKNGRGQCGKSPM